MALYAAGVDKVVPVSSARVAESCKLLENVFRSINIALVNELKVTFDRMGIDVWEVIEAAKTKPFGFTPFYPGPGLGGHCIPLDPFYLSWKAAEYGVWTRFIELAGEINTSMPRYVVEQGDRRAQRRRQEREGLEGAGARASPTRRTSTTTASRRRTRSSRSAGKRREGGLLRPVLPAARPAGRKHDIDLTSVPCDRRRSAATTRCVVSTAHTQFKDPALYAGVGLVIDTRNIVRASSAGPVTVVRA